MSALQSGSEKKAMWQTPLSSVSPWNETPRDSSSARAASTSSTWSAMGFLLGWFSRPTAAKSGSIVSRFSPG